jgi:hypothetical protein
VVTGGRKGGRRGEKNIHAIAIEAVLARDGLPVELVNIQVPKHRGDDLRVFGRRLVRSRGTYQKAAPIWLPYTNV